MHTTPVTAKVTTITTDSIGLTRANEAIFPTNETDDLDKYMSKSFLPTPSMMFEFKEWFFKDSPSHAAPSDKGTMVSTFVAPNSVPPCLRKPRTKSLDPYHLLQKIKLG
ncbi:hypothetical protein V6N13_010351 [Hibiscus sabdariffa]